MMSETQTPEFDPLFQHLILLFSTTAMQHLGKLMNPATKKTEVDLEGAQFAIDMLTLLETRTKGNLADAEGRILRDALLSLRLNYVEVAGQKANEIPGAEAKQTEPVVEKSGSGPTEKKTENDIPRYHKTYG